MDVVGEGRKERIESATTEWMTQSRQPVGTRTVLPGDSERLGARFLASDVADARRSTSTLRLFEPVFSQYYVSVQLTTCN